MNILRTRSSSNELRLPRKPYETVLVMPATDMPLANRAALVMRERTDTDALMIIIEDDLRMGFIACTNFVFKATESIYFGYLAQDAFPGYHWLDYALDSLKKTDANLLPFNDGRFFGKLAVFGLSKRSWNRSLYGGDFFFGGYRSHYADTELSVIALASNSMVFNPNALLMEVDYEKHLHKNNKDDEVLYRERALTGFGGLVEPFDAE